jgi:drug/metabolite transporter (DMT)-like permease
MKNNNNFKDKEDIVNEKKTENKKIYVNLYFFEMSIGIIVTYTYMLISIMMNIINRILFHQYKFKFNFTLMFLQQSLCMITFIILSKTSSKFKEEVGEISFKDFQTLKINYISFAIIFIVNILAGFYGNQLVENTPMFLTLRKLLLVMVYLTDIFIGKKQLSLFTSLCIFLVTFGTFLAGIDNFSADYIGYIVVIIYNTLSVIYIKMTENFKKRTNITNLKLLVYNSFISSPILFMFILFTKEYQKIINHFTEGKIIEFGTYLHFFVTLFLSCSFCIGLIMCLFISNEKNSSLFTTMLSNSKDIIITALSYFFLSNTKFTINVIGGLFITTIGAVLISFKSFYDNTKRIAKTKKLE